MEERKEKERAWLLKIHDLDQTLLIVLQEKHILKSCRTRVRSGFVGTCSLLCCCLMLVVVLTWFECV